MFFSVYVFFGAHAVGNAAAVLASAERGLSGGVSWAMCAQVTAPGVLTLVSQSTAVIAALTIALVAAPRLEIHASGEQDARSVQDQLSRLKWMRALGSSAAVTAGVGNGLVLVLAVPRFLSMWGLQASECPQAGDLFGAFVLAVVGSLLAANAVRPTLAPALGAALATSEAGRVSVRIDALASSFSGLPRDGEADSAILTVKRFAIVVGVVAVMSGAAVIAASLWLGGGLLLDLHDPRLAVIGTVVALSWVGSMIAVAVPSAGCWWLRSQGLAAGWCTLVTFAMALALPASGVFRALSEQSLDGLVVSLILMLPPALISGIASVWRGHAHLNSGAVMGRLLYRSLLRERDLLLHGRLPEG